MRARVELGDFGLPGSYMLDGDKWVWRDDRPLKPPSFKSVGFKYRADLQYLKHVLSYNDFRYRDHSDESKIEYRPFQPFSAVPDEGAALYLGWNGKLPNDPISLYVLLADVAPRAGRRDRADAEFLKNYYADRDAVWEAEQRVVWEYFDGTNWSPLVVMDGTKNFTVSGFVDFVGPDDHQKTMKFTEDRYWIRARLEMGGYVKPPRIARILHQHRRGGQRRHGPRRDPRLVGRHADPDLRLLARPAARGRADRGQGAGQPAAGGHRSTSATIRCGRRRRQGRRLLGALARRRELLRLGAALAPLSCAIRSPGRSSSATASRA